ncbi:alpha-ketoacid dehydrogenase kinase [Tilletiaria anomala UBC 951]|uniref:Protein-serine/threonine kinase n=1 Tax=Tilletiaria anomala (strain ATCC 24038 / CBS 436.72 / UBC 951) TaxID=1037660 RepID=A0A066WR33_TILAU|nr:alpha-ketoacid dehydrogenase kinase [Tilletiaria anomala UBC 951]KDN53105.1 alpha-ketoacid dehydrogenase kinase [Tilletiaria anomala UBC 951]
MQCLATDIKGKAPSRRWDCLHARKFSTSPQYPPPDLFKPGSSSFSPSDDRQVDDEVSSKSTFMAPPSAFSTFGASPTLLAEFLSIQPTPLTLNSLLSHAPAPGQVPTTSQLIESAEFTRRELPIRLARRVGGFRSLPFIVGSNPYIQQIARLYSQSFETLARFPEIVDLNDHDNFVSMLESLVEDHAQNVPILARGFLECKKYMDAREVSAFLDAAIHSRIAIRLIAEQHLSIAGLFHDARRAGKTGVMQQEAAWGEDRLSVIGVVDTKLSPARMVKTCAQFVHGLCEGTLGAAPELVLEGDVNSTYIGVPVHLEYVMTELLKNSYRATTERWRERAAARQRSNRFSADPPEPMPPIKVSISKSRNHLSMRIRDQGGGISPKNLPHIFSYAFTTVNSAEDDAGSSGDSGDLEGPYAIQAVGGVVDNGLGEIGASGLLSGLGTLAGLGYGLPMARIYATYFGGGSALDIVSLYGHGCDTFIKLPADPLHFQ